ncbi:MAG TPA: universal stress protein [Nitrolancea sp.]|nr:universal stress protein [Nitrolancea sp.]
MEPVVKTILLATDGSPDSLLATRAAADLAVLTSATLHVIHVWSQLTPVTVYPYPAVTEDFIKLYEDQEQAVLAEAVERIAAMGGPPAVPHLQMGRPVDEILALGRELGADLIVAGSHGRGAFGRVVIGSVAEGLTHDADVPVLVVRGGEQSWPPQRVVVGDDGSDEALAAAAFAFRLGRLFDASCLLVHVIPDAPISWRRDVGDFQELLRRTEKVAAERAHELGQRSETQPEPVVRVGDPATELAAIADEGAATLVAVGKRGLGRIERLRLGSVSTKVLRAVAVPVLIGPNQAG